MSIQIDNITTATISLKTSLEDIKVQSEVITYNLLEMLSTGQTHKVGEEALKVYEAMEDHTIYQNAFQKWVNVHLPYSIKENDKGVMGSVEKGVKARENTKKARKSFKDGNENSFSDWKREDNKKAKAKREAEKSTDDHKAALIRALKKAQKAGLNSADIMSCLSEVGVTADSASAMQEEAEVIEGDFEEVIEAPALEKVA